MKPEININDPEFIKKVEEYLEKENGLPLIKILVRNLITIVFWIIVIPNFIFYLIINFFIWVYSDERKLLKPTINKFTHFWNNYDDLADDEAVIYFMGFVFGIIFYILLFTILEIIYNAS